MTLTQDDLKAIRAVVVETVNDAVDDVKQQTAAGFAEVHEKFAEINGRFAEVNDKFAEVNDRFTEVNNHLASLDNRLENVENAVGRIENIQRAEINRVDKLEVAVKNLQRHAGLAA